VFSAVELQLPNCQSLRAALFPQKAALKPGGRHDDGRAWFLLNASPDCECRLSGRRPSSPQRVRDSPIAGVLLTSADIDQIAACCPSGIAAVSNLLHAFAATNLVRGQ